MKKAAEILSRMFDKSTFDAAQGFSELFSSWNSIVGDPCSAHSRIAELDRSILIVEADHPGWIQLLQSRQKELLDRTRTRFPNLSISGITFRLAKASSPLGSPQAAAERNRGRPEGEQLSPQADVAEIGEDTPNDSSYDRIEDESFKEALRRLEQSIIVKNKGR